MLRARGIEKVTHQETCGVEAVGVGGGGPGEVDLSEAACFVDETVARAGCVGVAARDLAEHIHGKGNGERLARRVNLEEDAARFPEGMLPSVGGGEEAHHFIAVVDAEGDGVASAGEIDRRDRAPAIHESVARAGGVPEHSYRGPGVSAAQHLGRGAAGNIELGKYTSPANQPVLPGRVVRAPTDNVADVPDA